MSIESHLRETLAFTGLPCAQTKYTGEEKTYLVFTFSTTPVSFADDRPWYERYLFQLYLIAPITQNVRTLIQSIKNALAEADYAYPSMTDISDDTKGASGSERHIVLEFERAVPIDG